MKTFIRLFKYIRYRWGSFVFGTVLSICSAGLSIYAPMIGSRVIDMVTADYKAGRNINFTMIGQQVIFYLIVVNTGIFFAYGANLILAKSSNDISKIIRDEAHEHMQKLPVSYFDNKPAGKISARIVNDTESLRQNYYMNFMNQILLNLITVIGIYMALYYVNPTIGLALLGLIPIFIIWQYVYMKKIQPLNLKWREIISELNSQIAELIQGVSIVQLFKREATMQAEFEATNQDWLDTRNKMINMDSTLTWNFADLLKNMVTFSVLAYVGTQFTNGILGISVGTLYLIIEYVSRLFDPITMIVRLLSFVQQALAAGSRIFELMDSEPEADTDKMMEITDGVVEFDHVHFGYKEGQTVLKDINFKVDKGQTIGLVGHTGSGKSSIINLLFRFYDPQSGEIRIDGQNIREYNRESIRDAMGIVLQEPYLFSGTIASNVSMHDGDISDEKVLDSLEKVGAQDMLSKLSKGIEEPVQEKGQSLSSGERQLISFARALASDPKVLILDEATSHIDTETEAIIQNAMNVVKEGRTTFIVAHRLSTIQNADIILVLDKGEIIELGNHEELMALDGQYAEMYHLQAQVAV